MEEIEKSGKAQLAREIEIALPIELDRATQLSLVRAYVWDNFVTAGMCADFALHDKCDGNPHAHIMLTMRPLEQSGEWDAKCRKEYDLDARSQRIPDGKVKALKESATLSQKNDWIDETGKLYLVFPIGKIANAIDKSSMTVKNSLNELDAAGLFCSKPNLCEAARWTGNFTYDGQKTVP